MNAKMVVTVDMESIPDRVSEILDNISNKLNELSNEVYYCSVDSKQKNDLFKQIETLDLIRQKLTTVDLNIEDCYSILKGYVGYHLELEKKQEQEMKDESLS